MKLDLTILVLLLGTIPVFADQPKPSVPVHEPTVAEKAFDDILRSVEKTIRSAKSYRLAAEAEWKHVTYGTENSGKIGAVLTVEGESKMRLEVGQGNGAANYQVVGDGKELTRLYLSAKVYSKTPCDDPLQDIQTDGLTVRGLMSIGFDFFLHPDFRGCLEAQITGVEDRGESKYANETVRTFRVTLVRGSTAEILFRIGDNPLPVALKMSSVIHTDKTTSFKHSVETRLKWDLKFRADPATFALTIPTDCKKVNDLTETILGVDDENDNLDVSAVRFKGIDNKTVSLADYKGKSVVLVYSWASWSPASIEWMEKLNQIQAKYAPLGVTVLVVNAGESGITAHETARKSGVKGTELLDPAGEGLQSLRLTTVPGLVVINRDGKVSSPRLHGSDLTNEAVKAILDPLVPKHSETSQAVNTTVIQTTPVECHVFKRERSRVPLFPLSRRR